MELHFYHHSGNKTEWYSNFLAIHLKPFYGASPDGYSKSFTIYINNILGDSGEVIVDSNNYRIKFNTEEDMIRFLLEWS